MRRPRDQRNARDKWYFIAAAVLVTATVATIAGVALIPKEEALSANLCPASGPKGHVVVLIDATDPFTFTQTKAVQQLVEQMTQTSRTAQGTLLTVYVLGEDINASSEPAFERCNPGSGDGKSEFTHTLPLWERRFKSEFQDPLRRRLPEMWPKAPASRSPIMEMLQVASLAFGKHQTGERRLLVVSDMLQNTASLSLYREIPSYDQFRTRPEARRLRADLSRVTVEAHMLFHAPQIQDRRLVKFWEDYFSDMGSSLAYVKPIPG